MFNGIILLIYYIKWISKMVHPIPFGNSLTSLFHNSASLQGGTVFYHVLSKTHIHLPKFKWHI